MNSIINFLKNPEESVCIFLSAGPKSGKTTFIKKFLYECSKRQYFDYGLVICPTIDRDAYDMVPEPYVYTLYNEKIISDLFNLQKTNRSRCFLILDDCLGSINWNSKIFIQLISRYRHHRISVVIAVQYPNTKNNVLRSCISHAILFKCLNLSALKALYENFVMSFQNFK